MQTTTYLITARTMGRLWDKAIDAKLRLTPNLPKMTHVLRKRQYHLAEQDLVNATGLDRETVREVLDFAENANHAIPSEWALSLDA